MKTLKPTRVAALARRRRPAPELPAREHRASMGQFRFSTTTTHPPAEAWRRIAAVADHPVPLTTGRGPDPAQLAEGDRLVTRTALGPVGFDDVMIVRTALPGRRLVLEKVGRLVQGTVDVRFVPDGDHVDVEWRQRVAFSWLPARLRPVGETLAARAVRPGYQAVVRRLLA